MQQATTTSLQSSDVVVDLGWAIVFVLDLGLGEKKKMAGNERSLLNGGESGNEANSMEGE